MNYCNSPANNKTLEFIGYSEDLNCRKEDKEWRCSTSDNYFHRLKQPPIETGNKE